MRERGYFGQPISGYLSKDVLADVVEIAFADFVEIKLRRMGFTGDYRAIAERAMIAAIEAAHQVIDDAMGSSVRLPLSKRLD